MWILLQHCENIVNDELNGALYRAKMKFIEEEWRSEDNIVIKIHENFKDRFNIFCLKYFNLNFKPRKGLLPRLSS